jgi:hypothetical protein
MKMLAALFLLLLLALPAHAEILTDWDTGQLIRGDFESRRGCYTKKGLCSLPEEKNEKNLSTLAGGRCPGDDFNETRTLALPATGGYTDTGNMAHYCRNAGAYWIYHTQGGFTGPVSYWLGPFPVGEQPATPEGDEDIPGEDDDSRDSRTPPLPDIGEPVPVKPDYKLKPGKPIMKHGPKVRMKPRRLSGPRPQLERGTVTRQAPRPRLGEPVHMKPIEKSPTLRILNTISPE